MGMNEFVGRLAVLERDDDLMEAIISGDKRHVDGLCKLRYRRNIAEAQCIREPLNIVKMMRYLEIEYTNSCSRNKTIHIW